MVNMSNHFKSFRPFKICYYLQLKFLNNNITHEFLNNRWILVQAIKLIGHFWKGFWSLRKYLAFLQYFILKNLFQTLGTKLNYLTIFFARQCTLIDNASEIPAILNIKITETLPSFSVTKVDIAKIVKNLHPNKVSGHNKAK